MTTKRLPPLVVVCGSTGTGKSKLAIELARLFGGEVINADVIQLYKGLDIATNKVSQDECQGVPHHMLGILSPQAGQNHDVHEYRTTCLPIISHLRDTGKLPILAGGTHYYLESILWTDFLSNKDSSFDNAKRSTALRPELSLNAQDSYQLLEQLNPTRAAHLHPKNLRKVRNALLQELVQPSTKSSPSQTEPSEFKPVANRSSEPRYPEETVIFWLDCALDVLDDRLNQRVDQMIQKGLLPELDSFLDYAFENLQNQIPNDLDHTEQTDSAKISRLFDETTEIRTSPIARRGILQSIGFKEFGDYLSLTPESRQSASGKRLLDEAIERVKISTRQYARRQIRWVVNRFLRRPALGGLPVYRLDVTEALKSDPSCWIRTVLAPAASVIHQVYTSRHIPLLESSQLIDILDAYAPNQPFKPEPFIDPPKPLSDADPPFVCASCADRQFNRIQDYQAHCKGRAHQKRVAKLRKRSLIDEVMKKSNQSQD